MSHRETELMFKGWGLTTAEFFYRLPDFRHVLQSYIWQDMDIAPRFPVLHKFLDFWSRELDGPLHSVQVAHRRLISAREVRTVTAEFRLH